MPQKMEVVLFVLVSNFILKPCWFLTNQFSHFLFFPPAVRFHWHACPSCLRNLPSPAIYLNVLFRWNFYGVLRGTTVAKSNQENLLLLGVKFNSESLPTLFFMMKHFGYYYVFLQYKHANLCRADVMRALHQYPTLPADLQNFSKWAFQFWKQFLTVGDRFFEKNFLCMCNDELFLNIFGFNKVKKQVSSLLITNEMYKYINNPWYIVLISNFSIPSREESWTKNIIMYILSRWQVRHGLILLWYKDWMNLTGKLRFIDIGMSDCPHCCQWTLIIMS